MPPTSMPARSQKTGADFEQVERRAQAHAGAGRERAQLRGGFVGIAAHA